MSFLTSDRYLELLKTFPPRPITSEEELIETQNRVDRLLDSKEFTRDDKDYLNVLGTLIYEYEQKQDIVPDIYGVELLKSLMEEMGLSKSDLVPIFKTEEIAADILDEKQPLTMQQMEELADFFHVSLSLFLPA
ncbi:MAG: transcriptional regulator [Cyanobacteria bacterium SBLK]|nr:transcriptional regulator [Cyanobacteria bacterium SBLK]